jgi:hypothetical protein
VQAATIVGMVLLNNQGTTAIMDDTLIQYLAWSPAAAPVLGVAACPLPADQHNHVTAGAGGMSTQLVDTAGYDYV